MEQFPLTNGCPVVNSKNGGRLLTIILRIFQHTQRTPLPRSFLSVMYGGFQVDKRVFTETFSDDSLGESTRSLLSPVYGDGGRFEPPELSEGSLSSDGEIENEILDRSEHSWKDYSFDRSNSSAKHRKEKSTTPTNSSFSGFKRSSTKSTTSDSRSNTGNRKSESTKTAESKGNCLSPWETWLVKKTAEDREKTKQKRLQQRMEKEQKEKEEREREELLKQASGKYEEWLENKKRVITEESRKKRLQEQLEREKKENSIRLISEKAEVKYNSWLEDKKAQQKEKRKKEEEEARMKKDREVERKLHNEEAYSHWIAEVKDRPKPVYNSFGYTGGILTGYYEWGSYPAPSYCNPVPWVPPKVKRNNERRKGKMEMQPASPPLLFRDIENRKAKEKRR